MVCPYNKTSYPASRRAPTRSSSYLGGESGDTASAILVCARARCGICLSPRPVRQRSRPQRYIRISPPFSTMGCSWTCLSSKRPCRWGHLLHGRTGRAYLGAGEGPWINRSPIPVQRVRDKLGERALRISGCSTESSKTLRTGSPQRVPVQLRGGGRFALAPSKGSVNKENGCRDEGTLDFTIVVEHTVAS